GNYLVWTHYIDVDSTVDVRDGCTRAAGFDAITYSDGDEVRIPDGSGSRYVDVWVEVVNRGSAQQWKRAYLLRAPAVWPGPGTCSKAGPTAGLTLRVRRRLPHAECEAYGGDRGSASRPPRRDGFRLLPIFVQPPPLPRLQIAKFLPVAGGPQHGHVLGPAGAAQAGEQPAVAGRQVAAAAGQEQDLLLPARPHLQAGTDGGAVAPLAVADQLQTYPVVVPRAGVVQQRRRAAVVAEGQVGPAVVVVVGPGQAAADVPLPEITPRPGGNVAEAAAALPLEELRLLGERRPEQLLRHPLHVPVGHHHVGPAVQVGVEEHRAEAEPVDARQAQARGGAALLKNQPAAVEEQDVRLVLEVADEQRRPPAAVEVARRD